MKTFREFLLEGIKYTFLDKRMERIDSFRNDNEIAAKSIIKNADKDAIEYINELGNNLSRLKDEKEIKEIKKQNDTKDILISTYILAYKDPDFLKKHGINEPENFKEDERKKIIEDEIIRPQIETLSKKEEKPEEETQKYKKPEEGPEEGKPEEEPEEEPEGKPEEEEPEEENSKKEKTPTKSSDYRPTFSGSTNPNDLMQELEDYKQLKIKQFEDKLEEVDPEFKGDKRKINNAKKDILRIIDREASNLEKFTGQYKSYIEPYGSYDNAPLNLKKFLLRLRRKATDAFKTATRESEIKIDKMLKKQLPGFFGRMKKRVSETIDKTKSAIKRAGESRIPTAIKRGTSVAKEIADKNIGKIKIDLDRKSLTNKLEYIAKIFNANSEEYKQAKELANKIANKENEEENGKQLERLYQIAKNKEQLGKSTSKIENKNKEAIKKEIDKRNIVGNNNQSKIKNTANKVLNKIKAPFKRSSA